MAIRDDDVENAGFLDQETARPISPRAMRSDIQAVRPLQQTFDGSRQGAIWNRLAPYTNFQVGQFALGVGGGPVRVDFPVLKGRSLVRVKNNSPGVIFYIGPSSGITAATGYPMVFTGAPEEFYLDESQAIWAFGPAAIVGAVQFAF